MFNTRLYGKEHILALPERLVRKPRNRVPLTKHGMFTDEYGWQSKCFLFFYFFPFSLVVQFQFISLLLVSFCNENVECSIW